MAGIQFKKATRKKVKLKALFTGPTGSGKTFGALYVADGLAPGKICLLDSEHDRSDFYADLVPFDSATPESHHPKHYMAAIDAMVDAGYEVGIIDSLSHCWMDVLARKDAYDKANPRSNQWTNWAIFGAEWDALMRKILEAPIHIICTARSKMAHEQVENGGKKTVMKLGLAPQLRDGSEYEFAIVLSVESSHYARVEKDNTNLLTENGRVWDLRDGSVPALLRQWLSTAKDVERPTPDTIMAIDDALLLVPQAKQEAARRKVAERRQRGMTEEEGLALLASIRSVIPSARPAPANRVEDDVTPSAEEEETEAPTPPVTTPPVTTPPNTTTDDAAELAAREALSAAASMTVKLSTGSVTLGDCTDHELLRIGLMAEEKQRARLVNAVRVVQADRERLAHASANDARPDDDAPPHSADDAPTPDEAREDAVV